MMMPICKQTYMPLAAEEVEVTVHEAFYVATTGRGGPIVINIPKDVQNQSVSDAYRLEAKNFRPTLPGLIVNHGSVKISTPLYLRRDLLYQYW